MLDDREAQHTFEFTGASSSGLQKTLRPGYFTLYAEMDNSAGEVMQSTTSLDLQFPPACFYFVPPSLRHESRKHEFTGLHPFKSRPVSA